MKINQSGFTLGQLTIVIVLLAGIAIGGTIFLKNKKQSEQTQKIEAMLIEMKARVGATLLEQDQSATFGDAIKNADDNAVKADEALVQLKTLAACRT
jgi:nanoRNase/pAp phosphatase (c-di-AMP/oligoRNAs hydrolase)